MAQGASPHLFGWIAQHIATPSADVIPYPPDPNLEDVHPLSSEARPPGRHGIVLGSKNK